jgi:hypothetical protein
MEMKTGIECLRQNDKEAASGLLSLIREENIAFEQPERHAKLLGYPYNRGDFETDEDNGVRRLMVELKILSIYGRHACPPILLKN